MNPFVLLGYQLCHDVAIKNDAKQNCCLTNQYGSTLDVCYLCQCQCLLFSLHFSGSRVFFLFSFSCLVVFNYFSRAQCGKSKSIGLIVVYSAAVFWNVAQRSDIPKTASKATSLIIAPWRFDEFPQGNYQPILPRQKHSIA